MKVTICLLDMPFQERCALVGAEAHTHTKAFRSVKVACTNQTFDDTFLLLYCLCFIKISAYSHVTILGTAAID